MVLGRGWFRAEEKDFGRFQISNTSSSKVHSGRVEKKEFYRPQFQLWMEVVVRTRGRGGLQGSVSITSAGGYEKSDAS